MDKTNRRNVVKNVSGFALGASFMPFLGRKPAALSQKTRILGKTGEKVSILGIGGYHIGVSSLSDKEAIEIIRTAIDRGMNFMDNAWFYHGGRSEILMGRALRDGYREKVFLMTKVEARTVEQAKIQMEASLNRFKLDRVDLMQFHAIGKFEGDVDAIYNNGLIKWAEEQRSQGVFKYIGFTGHTDPSLHLDMIKRGYPWDTVQMPVNLGDYHRSVSFQHDVLSLALEKNMGIIGMKTNGAGQIGKLGIAKPTEALRYAMSSSISTTVSGIDSLKILEENLAVFEQFRPLSELEKMEMVARSKGQSDEIEPYRSYGR
jgi:predicted aldo/keto reductase-like oxidoreductase